MSFWSKLASSVLVILIGTMASLMFVLSQGERLRQDVDQYPSSATAIHLYGVSEDHAAAVLSLLGKFADSEGHAIVRVDHEASNVDGGLSALRIGVAANADAPPSELSLRFLGTSLVDTSTISKLLTSDPGKSIGLDANATDVIAGIPELTFAPRLSVVSLGHLVESSGTVNGTYRVVGANPAQVNDLMGSLASSTGQWLSPLRPWAGPLPDPEHVSI